MNESELWIKAYRKAEEVCDGKCDADKIADRIVRAYHNAFIDYIEMGVETLQAIWKAKEYANILIAEI